MNKFEYVIMNLYVIAFMAVLWMTTEPFHVDNLYYSIFLPLFGLMTLYFGETLWKKIIYSTLYPLERD